MENIWGKTKLNLKSVLTTKRWFLIMSNNAKLVITGFVMFTLLQPGIFKNKVTFLGDILKQVSKKLWVKDGMPFFFPTSYKNYWIKLISITVWLVRYEINSHTCKFELVQMSVSPSFTGTLMKTFKFNSLSSFWTWKREKKRKSYVQGGHFNSFFCW